MSPWGRNYRSVVIAGARARSVRLKHRPLTDGLQYQVTILIGIVDAVGEPATSRIAPISIHPQEDVKVAVWLVANADDDPRTLTQAASTCTRLGL